MPRTHLICQKSYYFHKNNEKESHGKCQNSIRLVEKPENDLNAILAAKTSTYLIDKETAHCPGVSMPTL